MDLRHPQDKWSAVYSVQTILLSLQSLLGGKVPVTDSHWECQLTRFTEPNNASPLNPDAAAIWDSPEGRYIRTDVHRSIADVLSAS